MDLVVIPDQTRVHRAISVEEAVILVVAMQVVGITMVEVAAILVVIPVAIPVVIIQEAEEVAIQVVIPVAIPVAIQEDI